MMWYLQLLIEWAGWLLAQEMFHNAAFACLALWSGFGQQQRACAVLTALVCLAVMLS
jgi:hypothetical protein